MKWYNNPYEIKWLCIALAFSTLSFAGTTIATHFDREAKVDSLKTEIAKRDSVNESNKIVIDSLTKCLIPKNLK